MGWKCLDTGKRSARENMALDEALLGDLEKENGPILHLYDWEGASATFGYFIDPEKFLNIKAVKKRSFDLARRPTGGGITFHNCDLAFSVLIPASHPYFSANPLENYAFINKRVIRVLRKMGECAAELMPKEPPALDLHCRSFCMAKPTKYDVMIRGKKVGGAAQRKTRHGFLHQGSISLGSLPDQFLREMLLPETRVAEGMRQNSFALLGDRWSQKELEEARREVRSQLIEVFGDNGEID